MKYLSNLQQHLNDKVKEHGNRLYNGLGDILTMPIDKKSGKILTKVVLPYAVYSAVLFFHGAKLIRRDSILPITEHIGDFSFVGTAIIGISLYKPRLEKLGRKYKSRIIEKIGQYLPEITTVLTTTYFTLGESILPQLLPGTADPKDIPANVIAALSAYFIVKDIVKK